MTTPEDVAKLAALARIRLTDEELPLMARELDSILAYMGQLESLNIDANLRDEPTLKNVFRSDTNAHEPGAYTEALASQFPKRSGNHLSVKKIISHD